MNSFLLLGVITSVPDLVKIIKKCDRESAYGQDRQTHAQMETGYVICPMLLHSHGTDNKTFLMLICAATARSGAEVWHNKLGENSRVHAGSDKWPVSRTVGICFTSLV